MIKTVAKLDSPFVFTTTLTSPISGYGKAKGRLDELMSIPPWRVHDLRRTAASGMAKLGFQPHVVERVLNHVSGAQGGLVGVYQRYEYADERRKALHAWGSYVEALITQGSQPNNVIPLRA
jgi:integrase